MRCHHEGIPEGEPVVDSQKVGRDRPVVRRKIREPLFGTKKKQNENEPHNETSILIFPCFACVCDGFL